MEQQGKLFDLGSPDLTPLSHAGDPETSRIAAAHHEASGQLARNLGTVLSIVGRLPGLTAIELWERATDDERKALKEPQEVRRRLTDLLREGRVRQGPRRVCAVRGTQMVTWF